MKSKIIILLATVSLVVFTVAPGLVFGQTPDVPSQEQFLDGQIRGAGKYFEVKNSEYLNVTLNSTEEVGVFLESIPEIINLDIKVSNNGINSTELTLGGLEPDKTYYQYQDSYKNKSVFVSDDNGNYSWTQDLTELHHIWFQEAAVALSPKLKSFTAMQSLSAQPAGLVFLPEQCADYGVWDSATSTCTLNKDLSQKIEITADNTTLDCNNHSITGRPIDYGIFLGRRNEVAIENCKISGFVTGIYPWDSTNVLISNNDISDSYYAIFTSYSSGNSITGNNVASNGIAGSGIYLYYSYGNAIIGNNTVGNIFQGIGITYSDENIITNNNIANNNRSMTVYGSYDNQIYHNNFVNNLQQVRDINGADNLFDDGYPAGGNYWSDYNGVDLNSDGIGNMPYVFAVGQDNYPFIVQNGWNVPPEPTKTPILIVPGILGTNINKGGDKLWLDLARNLTDIGDSFMDPLQFNQNLTPSDVSLSTGDVISKETVNVGVGNLTVFDYTSGLIQEFTGQGYEENKDLFTFPYDWRYGVSGKYADGKTNVDLLKTKIADILQQTGADKIDIVAHSNGGLVVKKYVMDNPTSHHIGKAVFVGVPNTGAPKAVKALIQGDDFGISFGPFGLNEAEMKKISQNMPVVYDLLPTQKYYDTAGSFVSLVDFTAGDPTEKDLNYSEFKSYLGDKGFNSIATVNSESLHAQAFDDFDLRTVGVDLYAIDGCKTATATNFLEVTYKDIFGRYHTDYDRVDLKTGDGTVPMYSSTNLPINEDNKFYALATGHSKLLSADGSRQEIVNLLSGSALNVAGNLITQDVSKCELNGKAISVFSPVNIFVTDQDGNKLGLAEDGSIINEIPNADFEILGEHKFLYLPQDGGQTYNINIQGTGTGTYTIKSQSISNSQVVGTEVFSNLSVTPELIGQININPSDNTTTLSVNNSPLPILPSATLDASESTDIIPPVSVAILSGNLITSGIYLENVAVGIKTTDSGSGVLAIQYNLDNNGYQKVSGDTASFTVSSAGKHSVTFFATDRAGNNSQEQIINFEIRKLPTSKDQCKNNGWKNFGNRFKNQGDCVSFVEKKK